MRVSFAVMCAAAVLCACSDSSVEPAQRVGSPYLTLTPSSNAVMTSAGDLRTVAAVLRTPDALAAVPVPLTWSANVPNVVEIIGTDTGAVLVAVGDGTATITASAGAASASFDVTVRRVVAFVELTAPDTVVPTGQSVQLNAVARDARHYIMYGTTGFSFASTNTSSIVVSNTGLATGLFNPFSTVRGAKIIAALALNGTTVSDTLGLVIADTVAPPRFEYAAFMLTDYERPEPIPAPGVGISYFTESGNRIGFTMLWSALSGPATTAHIHGAGNFGDIADVLVNIPLGAQHAGFGKATGSFSASDIRAQGNRAAISLDSLRTLLRTGRAYVDMHTAAHRDGEIRGQSSGF